jgi:glycosyltransferase involved in cell wall biosynthesis/tetratricopeptide (TPR) repeat protein
MALRQQLAERGNDYSPLETEYWRVTQGELVTEPLLSPEQGPLQITKTASILIGSHNSCESLRRSLLSVAQSSFHRKYPTQLEIVLVDDGSTDGTRQMVQSLELSVPVKYVLEDRSGLSKAHNTGAQYAEGDILIFSDSDMVHTIFAIEEMMKRFEVLRNVTLLGFRYEIDSDDPRISPSAIMTNLCGLLPDFDYDFRLRFPGFPDNVCRDTRHLKDYGWQRQVLFANGGSYDLPSAVIGAFFALHRLDYIQMGGSDERLVGWAGEDTLIGARSIALGNYIVPVYSAASAHISHPLRFRVSESDRAANHRMFTSLMDAPFPGKAGLPDCRGRVREFFQNRPIPSEFQNGLPKNYPPPAFGSYRRGCVAFALGHFERALDYFAMGGLESPDSPWPELGRGKAMREIGQTNESVRVLSECAERHPANGWARFELAISHAAATDYGKARCVMQAVRESDPTMFDPRWVLDTSPVDHKRRGNHHANHQLHRLAVRDFDLALLVAPDYAWAHFDRGISLRALGRPYEALAAFDSTGKLLHPDDNKWTWVRSEMGKALSDLGQVNEAKLQLETALRLYPGNTQARTWMDELHTGTEQQHGILCSLSLLRAISSIDGWLSDEEADLLISAVLKVAQLPGGAEKLSLVEIGSFCGKSTVVIGRALKALGPSRFRFYAIDPHNGYFLAEGRDTYALLQKNITHLGLEQYVTIMRNCSTAVAWDKPIALLYIDGLHDYENVRADYLHFKDSVIPEGLLAFHDYIDYCPGVQQCVDEVLHAGDFQFVAQRERMILLRKAANAGRSSGHADSLSGRV